MNLISLVGLVCMLLVAWAMSFHRRDVKVRPIIWGMGLQILFALIIIRKDVWSFVGMVILAALIVTYNFKHLLSEKKWGPLAGLLAVSGAVGFGLGQVDHRASWFLIAIAFLLVMIKRWVPVVRGISGYLVSLGLAGAVGVLIASGISGEVMFQSFSDSVAYFLTLSDYGAKFMFGNLADAEHFFPNSGTWPGFGFLFAFKVLPTIVFFGGFMGVLYYMGVMQSVIETVSKFMRWTIGTSGAETLSCSANIFVGQTEAPLLIKPFLGEMTKSELCTIMIGGFATIAGGVLAGYISMGVPAGHLIAASVMSAPAALVIGKIIYPEKEHSQTAGDVPLPKISVGENVLDAASHGISDGLKLAVNVGAMLVGFIALIAVLDLMLNTLDNWVDNLLLGGEYIAYGTTGVSPAVGEYNGIIPGSLQTLFGTILSPLAFVMGVPWDEAHLVGNLLGIKLSLNEFVAFGSLGTLINDGALSNRSMIIASYALCGFANFSSIGIQVGGLGALAKERRGDLAKVGLKAMFGGALASWTTACIAGLFLG